MSGETINPKLHDQMQQDVDAARQAAISAGTYDKDDFMGSEYAAPEVSEHISSGDLSETHGVNVKTTNHTAKEILSGKVPTTEVSASATKIAADGPAMEYHSKIETPQADGSQVNQAEATVERWSNGQKVYEHSFKDPDTARKFNSLIAKQTVRRLEVPEQRIAA